MVDDKLIVSGVGAAVKGTGWWLPYMLGESMGITEAEAQSFEDANVTGQDDPGCDTRFVAIIVFDRSTGSCGRNLGLI